MTMGTASTMTALAEAMGLSLPGASSIPAPDSHHTRMSAECGKRVVEMVWEDLTPRAILTPAAFENAVVVDMAIGGSTNAIIHLAALARRCGIEFDLRLVDQVSRRVPVLANIRPSGACLMEDFYYAGGLPALLRLLGGALHTDAITVTGKTLGENIAGARVINPDVIRLPENPLSPEGGTAILFGSLAPDGAVIKTSAASPNLLRHTGPAVVFHDYRDMEQRIHRDDLEADENSVFVLQNAGPLGGPGMPEWGMLPIPRKLLERGVRDMVRISDARMSGTSYGTCVLHVAPEAFVGGPLAMVRDGDPIVLDVPARRLDLLVLEAEIDRRRAAWTRAEFPYRRGYLALFAERVTQANEGCDFDFLAGTAESPEPEIH